MFDRVDQLIAAAKKLKESIKDKEEFRQAFIELKKRFDAGERV